MQSYITKNNMTLQLCNNATAKPWETKYATSQILYSRIKVISLFNTHRYSHVNQSCTHEPKLLISKNFISLEFNYFLTFFFVCIFN